MGYNIGVDLGSVKMNDIDTSINEFADVDISTDGGNVTTDYQHQGANQYGGFTSAETESMDFAATPESASSASINLEQNPSELTTTMNEAGTSAENMTINTTVDPTTQQTASTMTSDTATSTNIDLTGANNPQVSVGESSAGTTANTSQTSALGDASSVNMGSGSSTNPTSSSTGGINIGDGTNSSGTSGSMNVGTSSPSTANPTGVNTPQMGTGSGSTNTGSGNNGIGVGGQNTGEGAGIDLSSSNVSTDVDITPGVDPTSGGQSTPVITTEVSTSAQTTQTEFSLDDLISTLRNYGINDTDINRVLTGEIGIQDLITEILSEQDPSRRKLLYEASYLHELGYEYNNLEQLEAHLGELLSSLSSAYRQRAEMYNKSVELDFIHEIIERLQYGEDLEHILASGTMVWKYTDDFGNVYYAYYEYNNLETEFNPYINGQTPTVENLTYEEILGDSALLVELKTLLSKEDRKFGFIKKTIETVSVWSDSEALLAFEQRVDTDYTNDRSTRQSRLDAIYATINDLTNSYNTDKYMLEYIQSEIEYYINCVDNYTIREDFSENNGFNPACLDVVAAIRAKYESNLSFLTNGYYGSIPSIQISSEEEIAAIISCILNGEGSLYGEYISIGYSTYKLASQDLLISHYAKWAEIMPEENIQIFNYIFNTQGAQAAYQYLVAISSQMDKSWLINQRNKDTEFALNYPVLASIGSIFLTPVEGINAMLASMNALITKVDIARTDVYSAGDVWRSAIASDIAIDHPTLSFLYSTGMSMADSLMLIGATALTGGTATGFISFTLMGSRAYVSTLNDALDRGLSDGKAVLLAWSSAIVETAMESYSTVHLLNLESKLGDTAVRLTKEIASSIKNPKLAKIATDTFHIFAMTLSQAFVEGSEEFDTEILNYLFDNLISGNLSNHTLRIAEYIEQGMSEEDARRQANRDFASQLKEAFAGGFVSGLFFGGFAGTKSTYEASSEIARGIIEEYRTGNGIQSTDISMRELLSTMSTIDAVTLATQMQENHNKAKAIEGMQKAIKMAKREELFTRIVGFLTNSTISNGSESIISATTFVSPELVKSVENYISEANKIHMNFDYNNDAIVYNGEIGNAIYKLLNFSRCIQLKDGTFKFYPIKSTTNAASMLANVMAQNNVTLDNADQILECITKLNEFLEKQYKAGELHYYYGNVSFMSERLMAIMNAISDMAKSEVFNADEKAYIAQIRREAMSIFEKSMVYLDSINNSGLTMQQYDKAETIYLYFTEIENNLAKLSEKQWQEYFKQHNGALVHVLSGAIVASDVMNKICTSVLTEDLVEVAAYGQVGYLYGFDASNVVTACNEDAGSWVISKEEFIARGMTAEGSWQFTPDGAFFEVGYLTKLMSPEFVVNDTIRRNNELRAKNGQNYSYDYNEVYIDNRTNKAKPLCAFYLDSATEEQIHEMLKVAQEQGIPLIKLSDSAVRNGIIQGQFDDIDMIPRGARINNNMKVENARGFGRGNNGIFSVSNRINSFITDMTTDGINSFFERYHNLQKNYGADQGFIQQLYTDDYKNVRSLATKEYFRLKNKLISQGFSAVDASRVLKGLDNVGACSYAAIINGIFNHYKNNMAAFERTFGYKMVTVIDGQTVLNTGELLVDLYTFINDRANGGKLFRTNPDGTRYVYQLSGELDIFGRYILDAEQQQYMSTSDGIETDYIRRFLRSKGVNIDIGAVEIGRGIKSGITAEEMQRIIARVKDSLDRGLNVDLGIYSRWSKHTRSYIRLMPLEPGVHKVSTLSWSEGGGHALFITAIQEDGFVVSSWGNKYLIPFVDLMNGGRFEINSWYIQEQLTNRQISIRDTLLYAFKYQAAKYGYDDAIINFQYFLKYEDFNKITRDGDARHYLSNYSISEIKELVLMLNNGSTDMTQFFNMYFSPYNGSGTNKTSKADVVKPGASSRTTASVMSSISALTSAQTLIDSFKAFDSRFHDLVAGLRSGYRATFDSVLGLYNKYVYDIAGKKYYLDGYINNGAYERAIKHIAEAMNNVTCTAIDVNDVMNLINLATHKGFNLNLPKNAVVKELLNEWFTRDASGRYVPKSTSITYLENNRDTQKAIAILKDYSLRIARGLTAEEISSVTAVGSTVINNVLNVANNGNKILHNLLLQSGLVDASGNFTAEFNSLNSTIQSDIKTAFEFIKNTPDAEITDPALMTQIKNATKYATDILFGRALEKYANKDYSLASNNAISPSIEYGIPVYVNASVTSEPYIIEIIGGKDFGGKYDSIIFHISPVFNAETINNRMQRAIFDILRARSDAFINSLNYNAISEKVFIQKLKEHLEQIVLLDSFASTRYYIEDTDYQLLAIKAIEGLFDFSNGNGVLKDFLSNIYGVLKSGNSFDLSKDAFDAALKNALTQEISDDYAKTIILLTKGLGFAKVDTNINEALKISISEIDCIRIANGTVKALTDVINAETANYYTDPDFLEYIKMNVKELLLNNASDYGINLSNNGELQLTALIIESIFDSNEFYELMVTSPNGNAFAELLSKGATLPNCNYFDIISALGRDLSLLQIGDSASQIPVSELTLE